MLHNFLTIFLFLLSASPSTLNSHIEVIPVPDFAKGESQTITGNVSTGILAETLDWAAYSNVACFPGTRFVEFQGNQVFYSVVIPQGSELVASLNPTSGERINLYGYIDFTGENVPPISYCRTCESSYPLYAGTPNLNDPGGTRKISFSHAIRRSYTALIVVSGAQGVEEGEYELNLTLQ